MIIIMITKMNMQNKLYTTQFFPPPDKNPQSSGDHGTPNSQTTENLAKLPKKTKVLKKRGLKPTEKRRKEQTPCTPANPHS